MVAMMTYRNIGKLPSLTCFDAFGPKSSFNKGLKHTSSSYYGHLSSRYSKSMMKFCPKKIWAQGSCHLGRMWPRQIHSNIKMSEETSKERSRDSITSGPREFEISAQGKNPAFDYSSNKYLRKKVPSFKDLGLQNEILQGLDNMQICQPTVIQIKSIPEVLKGRDVFCAAQTGSGKTLAYVAPIINNLKLEEKDGLLTRYNRPLACIVSPYRELAVQILKVVKTMSLYAPVRSLGLIGGQKDHFMHKGFKQQPIDIIVGTPGTILDMQAKRKLFFTDLKYIVFDEADTMLDSTFKETTKTFISKIKQRSPDTGTNTRDIQYIFAAAILPQKHVLNDIKSLIPKLRTISAQLHHVLPHIRHKFIKTSQKDKPQLLLEVLQSRIINNRKTMIFVNSSSTCNWLSKFLEQENVNHKRLSGKIAPEERLDVFEDYKKDESAILVCTDIAARGLDTPDLFSVLNYDCPLNPTDYIHRAGRTGRARADYTGTPEVVTFLSRNWEVNLAKKIQTAAERKAEIEDVSIVRRKMLPVKIKR